MTVDVSEPRISIESREQLLYLLAEAAEIEHNLMCCYLFAAFSLKERLDEGVGADELEAIERWRRATTSVAIEEMTHLALVANLTTALGGAAHFSRPNFPVGAGLYPSGIAVQLAPFDRDTLQHFLYLERPEGSSIPDGASFASTTVYARETVIGKCMPSAQDYLTVGHLYRAIADGLAAMVARQGEERTFIGEREAQVGPDLVNLPGMSVVVDLKSALAAIEMIVDQGEGTRAGGADSHFARFAAIAREYDAFLARRADFVPHRPVARNPVMRRPPQPLDKVFVEEAEAAGVLDLANAVYGLMLRCLAQAFGRSGPPGGKRLLLDTASDLMSAAVPLARVLTMLPATKSRAGLTGGITFAMLRSVARTPQGNGEWALISERLSELADGAARLPQRDERVMQVAQALSQMAERFHRRSKNFLAPGGTTGAPMKSREVDRVVSRQAPEPQIEGEVETMRGSALTLKFEGKRCIHARFCVLGLPDVYRANVQGAWINPDAASLEANIGVAHNCPSGAIRYERHDGGPAEPAPKVNVVRLRENGPYAFNAQLTLDGKFVGYRATLCRCGASKNKPFCDGSHNTAGFVATGEPKAAAFEPLEVRDGELEIRPQRNGPLAVSGNLEVLSGTGRTVMKLTGTRLCRCGHSSSKPYCDNTHAKVGFVG